MKYSTDCSEASSMINSFAYDSDTKELTVIFKNGREYVYEDVELDVYLAMENAPSVGKYFNSIKAGLKVKQP